MQGPTFMGGSRETEIYTLEHSRRCRGPAADNVGPASWQTGPFGGWRERHGTVDPSFLFSKLKHIRLNQLSGQVLVLSLISKWSLPAGIAKYMLRTEMAPSRSDASFTTQGSQP